MKRVDLLSEKLKAMVNRLHIGNEWGVFFLFFVMLTSCVNHSMIGNRTPATNVPLLSQNSGTNGDFNLDAVMPDTLSPGSVFDLIGRNQEFDLYCGGTMGTCECEYTYTPAGGGIGQTETVSAASTYQEANMIRCPNSVPSGINSFTVKINVVPTAATGTTYHSRELSYNVADAANANGNASIYLDLTDEKSFMPVQRYQCRKREFIANPMDSSMLDPFQSMDPRVIYPFNYYTANVGESLLQMQRGNTATGQGGAQPTNDQSWDCTLSATPDGNLQWWANPNVYSKSACGSDFCSADGLLMYPQTSLSSGRVPAAVATVSNTSKRRASFALAKRAYGVFQTPVIAAIAPKDYVSSVYSTATSPLGWAAKPIPNISGSSSCPNVTIPANARWAKLWNFRANKLHSAKKVTASQSANNAAIACQPPSSFDSCMKASSLDTSLTSNPLSDGGLASRVVYYNSDPTMSACFRIMNGLSDPYSISAFETWRMSSFKFNNSLSVANMASFPFGVYQPAASAVVCDRGNAALDQWMFLSGACTDASAGNANTTQVPTPTPSEPLSNLTTAPLSVDDYTDQIFVVSDPEVNDSSMTTNALPEYTPVTYRSKSACTATDNSACPLAGYEGTEVVWVNDRTEINSANSTGPNVYPLCVLQFTE